VWLTDDDPVLAGCLEEGLRRRGLRPRLAPCAALPRLDRHLAPAGLVLLAPPGQAGDDLLRDALLGLQHAAPGLLQAAQQGGAVFVTVSRLDGAFGLGNLDPLRAPIDGGLAGLAKTAQHEWPGVRCKALDLGPDLSSPDQAAESILEEMFLAGPLEVGLGAGGRITLERLVRPLTGTGTTPPFQPGELVVLSGGARGVTAEVAVALARAFRPTLLLLGRSPEPGPEPDWLAPLTDEAAIKRELGRCSDGASPRVVGEQYRQVLAGREVRNTLARIEAAGARALYRSVDVRDPQAVAAVLSPLVGEAGPVRGLVHGAGVLADARLEDKTAEQFDRVHGTKVGGLRALVSALDLESLRALVLFSSSTGRFGRTGQADYAMANEVLNKLAQQQARRLPGCRVVSVNWGPWDGGMVTVPLKKVFAQEGIGLIGLEAGARYLVQELQAPVRDVEVVVLAPGSAAQPPPAGPAQPEAAPPLPLAFERVLDVAEHPVLHAHVLDGRPVLPMALILEWLAHGALHQNPGLLFHGANDFRILHGVTLEAGAPTLRIRAGKAVKRDGLFLAPAELRGDRPDGREVLHARAELVLAADLPCPPSPEKVPSLPPYDRPLEEIYPDQLFHGPDLQGIEQVEGCGEGGIVAWARSAPPPADWIRRPLRQKWLADPLVLDVSFQLMVLWARRQHGAACLPCHARRYRQYRRAFPADGVRVAATVTRHSGLHVLADLDYLDGAGQLVARLEGCESTIDPTLDRAFRRNRLVPALS
jgi:NAD(P)-dependent dehydrogenase (short-subunit alcohol dehydrogenase family)